MNIKRLLTLSVMLNCLLLTGCNSHKKDWFDAYTEPLSDWRVTLIEEFSETVIVHTNYEICTFEEKEGFLIFSRSTKCPYQGEHKKTFRFRVEYDRAAYNCAKSTGAEKEKQLGIMNQERDMILGKLIRTGKLIHEQQDDAIYMGQTGTNFLFDAGQLFTTAWATVAPVEATKNLLSAITLGTKGLQQSFNVRFFAEKTSSILLSQTQEDRVEKLKTLIEGMKQPADKYGLDIGLSDATTFMLAGGITDALANLAAKAEADKKKAEEELKKSIEESRVTAKELYDAQENVKTLEEQLKKLEDELNDPNKPVTATRKKVLEGEIEENKRKLFVAKVELYNLSKHLQPKEEEAEKKTEEKLKKVITESQVQVKELTDANKRIKTLEAQLKKFEELKDPNKPVTATRKKELEGEIGKTENKLPRAKDNFRKLIKQLKPNEEEEDEEKKAKEGPKKAIEESQVKAKELTDANKKIEKLEEELKKLEDKFEKTKDSKDPNVFSKLKGEIDKKKNELKTAQAKRSNLLKQLKPKKKEEEIEK